MSNIEFNPDERSFYTNMNQRAPARAGGLTGWFMKVLKTESEAKANGVMLILAVVFILLSVIIIWRFV